MIQETETSCRISISLRIYNLNKKLPKGEGTMEIIIADGANFNEIVTKFKAQAVSLTISMEVNDLRFNYKDDGTIILTIIYKA
jgi:hypothetical protein